MAINPGYAIDLLTNYPGGFILLGGVFLCTTGAGGVVFRSRSKWQEYPPAELVLGKNMPVVKLLRAGRMAAFASGESLGHHIPFFSLMPEWFLVTGLIITTLATIIASQALISGTFSLINEAMKLKLWPAARIRYPSELMGKCTSLR
jgi:KUP system potassium uptake protein